MFTKLLERENRLKKAKDYAISKGGKCLSEEYVNANTHLTWQCSEGHVWDSTYNVIVNQNKWCPKCKYSKPSITSRINSNKEYLFQRIKEHAILLGGTCLSANYKNQRTKLKFKCSNTSHPEWEATPFSIINGKTWCPKCSIEKNKNINEKFELAKNHALKKGGECISLEYLDSSIKLEWKCENKKHQPWFARLKNVVHQDQWCPQCANKKFKTENRVRLIFETYFQKSFISTRPEWNKSSITNKRLELDGYNELLKIAFEHDGEHHKIPFSYHKSNINNLIRQQQNDNFKKENCKKNDITLINIPILKYNERHKFFSLLKHVLFHSKKENIFMNFSLSQIRKMKTQFYLIK